MISFILSGLAGPQLVALIFPEYGLFRNLVSESCTREFISNFENNPTLMARLHQDTCRRIHVARSGYMRTVSRRHNYYSFMSRSTCIPLYPATNWQQFCRRYKKHVDGYKWIQVDTTCIRQHVSWYKCGIKEFPIPAVVY